MKIVCMTTNKSPQRKENIERYKQEIPNFVVHINDTVNALEHFVQVCDEFKSAKDGILFIEDDLKLCTGFLSKVQPIVEKHSDKVIQFFDMKKRDFIGFEEMRGSSFCGNVCVYIPSAVLEKVPVYRNEFLKKYPQYRTGCDYLLGYTLTKMKLMYLIYRPCLAQHLPFKSVINVKRSTGRKTHFFIEEQTNENN